MSETKKVALYESKTLNKFDMETIKDALKNLSDDDRQFLLDIHNGNFENPADNLDDSNMSKYYDLLLTIRKHINNIGYIQKEILSNNLVGDHLRRLDYNKLSPEEEQEMQTFFLL